MEAADILVTVDLAGYTAMDYSADTRLRIRAMKARRRRRHYCLGSPWMITPNNILPGVLPAASKPFQLRNSLKFGDQPATCERFREVFFERGGYPREHGGARKLLMVPPGTGRFSSLNYQMVQLDGNTACSSIRSRTPMLHPSFSPGSLLMDRSTTIPVSRSERGSLFSIGRIRVPVAHRRECRLRLRVELRFYRPFTKDSRWFSATGYWRAAARGMYTPEGNI